MAFIFPIELLSPPDLLYTILSVPLPIPPGGTEPAPPLTLLKFPSVNEDSVATALGYAALVVHLMAKYLCRALTYPITYVGSRTLIKDPISAMMGPRMYARLPNILRLLGTCFDILFIGFRSIPKA